MPKLTDFKAYNVGSTKVTKLYQGSTLVWSESPLPTTGMGLWLKADAIPGITNGQQILNWPDSSPSGFNSDANASGTGPTYHTEVKNGLPAASFGGPYMDIRGAGTWLTGRTEWSVSIALNNTSFANYPIILCSPIDSLWQWIIEYSSGGGGGDVYLGIGNGYYRNVQALLQPGWVILTVTKATSNPPRLWVNGTEMTVVNYLGPSGDALETIPDLGNDIRIGAYYNAQFPLQSEIGEIIMYDHGFSDTERQQVESYLRTKWAL